SAYPSTRKSREVGGGAVTAGVRGVSKPQPVPAKPQPFPKTAPPAIAGGRGQGLSRCMGLDAGDVCGVQSLLASTNLELYFLTFGECLETFHTDSREVNEHIFPAVLLNEAVPLGVIEPLHLPSGHSSCLLRGESILHCRCWASPLACGALYRSI